jgi:hypothetical protein
MSNPLIEKYNQIYKPPPPQPKYTHLSYRNATLITKLEWLLEKLKAGKASCLSYDVKDHYRQANPTIPLGAVEVTSEDIADAPYEMYSEGQLINIQVFNRYD